MVTDEHVCPFGLKARDLLQRKGFDVEDRPLTSRAEIDKFQAEHNVRTTPQIFFGGERTGSYDDLREHLGKSVRQPDALTYEPVIAVFLMAALMALATSWSTFGTLLTVRAGEWFLAFSMCILALLNCATSRAFPTCSWSMTCSQDALFAMPTSIPSPRPSPASS